LEDSESEDEDEISPARTAVEDDDESEYSASESDNDSEVVAVAGRTYLGGIACSSADLETRDLLEAAVNTLGGYGSASPETATIFVSGGVRRGPALLTAIARGIPVLSPEFLTKAITDGKWPTDKAKFETHEGAKNSRITKGDPKGAGFLKDKRIKLTGDLGINRASLSLMIRESGGRVVSTREDVVLSDKPLQSSEPNVVPIKWFADSVEEQRILPFESYRTRV
jgi:hypothetical protein